MSIETTTKQSDKITASLHLITIWLIGAILVLVPFLFTQSIFIGLIFSKTILFYGLTTLLIVIYSILIYFDHTFIPKLSKIGWLFLALLLILTISTIFSIQPYTSFWGSFDRMDGLLTWFYYFAFFVVVSGITKDGHNWLTIIRIAVSGMIVISIYALYKLWFMDTSFITIVSKLRAESSLGNPIFLGGYLAMSLPLVLSYILNKKCSRFKIISILAFALGTIALLFTLARGPWIAAVGAMMLVSGLYFYKYKRQILNSFIKIVIPVFAGLAIIVLSIGLINNPSNESLKNRFISTASVEHRLHTWSVGLQAFKEKPITGWGLENFKIAFNKHYKSSSKIKNISFTETHVDRAHNEYIDMAVTGGIPALIAYLLIIFLALITILKSIFHSSIKRNTNKLWINIGLAGTILAYAIYAITAFHLAVNILWLLLALAWVNNLTLKSNRLININYSKIASLIVVIATLTLSYYSVINPALAVNQANKGTIKFYQGNISESLDHFKNSMAYKSFASNPIQTQMAILIINNSTNNQEKSLNDFNNYINKVVDHSFITEPYNSYHHLLFGIYYSKLSQSNPNFIKKAEEHFQKSAQLSPGNGEAYFHWGKMYIDLNDKTKAKIKLDRAMLLTPNNIDLYAFVGFFYISTGEIDPGIILVQKAIDLGYDPENIKILLDTLEKPEEIEKIKQFYLDIIN